MEIGEKRQKQRKIATERQRKKERRNREKEGGESFPAPNRMLSFQVTNLSPLIPLIISHAPSNYSKMGGGWRKRNTGREIETERDRNGLRREKQRGEERGKDGEIKRERKRSREEESRKERIIQLHSCFKLLLNSSQNLRKLEEDLRI